MWIVSNMGLERGRFVFLKDPQIVNFRLSNLSLLVERIIPIVNFLESYSEDLFGQSGSLTNGYFPRVFHFQLEIYKGVLLTNYWI